MLIVFRREDKYLYRKCLECKYMLEFRDDPKTYPKTVGVVCGAPQSVMAFCFKYDWFRACSHYHGEKPESVTVTEPQIEEKKTALNVTEINKILDKIRKLYKEVHK